MTLPTPPGAQCTHAETRAYEAALLGYADFHGHTVETLSRLSQAAASRCAYREGVAWQHEALTRWPEMDNPLVGLSGRLQIIQLAVHAGNHEQGALWLDDLAGHPAIINAATAESILVHSRGLGMSASLRQMLSSCVQYLKPDSPAGALARVLHDDARENEQLVSAVRLISLGEGCYGWIQPNKYMLRSADDLDLLMPFNMLVSGELGVVSALEERCSHLVDPTYLRITRMVRDIPVQRNTRYGIFFNHECDDFYLQNEAAELCALYLRRVQHFLMSGCEGRRVYVITASEFEHVQRLERALAALMKDDLYRLLLIANCFDTSPRWPDRLLPTTRVAHVPIPYPGYNWTTDAGKEDGYQYDLAIYRLIRETMAEVAAL